MSETEIMSNNLRQLQKYTRCVCVCVYRERGVGAAKQARLSGCAREAKLEPHPHTLPTHTPAHTYTAGVYRPVLWVGQCKMGEGGRGDS